MIKISVKLSNMFKRFIGLNIKYSKLLAKKYPIFFCGKKIAKHDLIYLVKNHIAEKKFFTYEY